VLAGAAGVATGPITITSQTGAGSAAWGAITAAIAPANPTPTQTRYGYLGSKQRYTSTGAGIIEMGARLYAPQLGRFLQTDPIEGGSANDYDYAYQDPLNSFDVDGRGCYGANCKDNRVKGCMIGQCPGNRPISVRQFVRTVFHKVKQGGSAVNRWTWTKLNPFNSQSALTRWVGDHARDLGDLLGCSLSFKTLGKEGADVCLHGIEWNDAH
jgi:RHS repeat-associated protein